MIRCIAIDDEPLALKQLSAYIRKTPFLELLASCHSPFEAMGAISAGTADLLFADIHMPDLDGITFVKSIPGKPMIIFTTAYSEYALEGFRVNALDYLLKPIGYSDFLISANKALRQYELLHQHHLPENSNEPKRLFLKSEGKMIPLEVADIMYIESLGEYIRIHTETGSPIVTLCSLKSIEHKLPSEKFMRIHRGCIVQLNKIHAIAKGRVVMNKQTYLPIGEQYKDAFQQYLDENSLKKND